MKSATKGEPVKKSTAKPLKARLDTRAAVVLHVLTRNRSRAIGNNRNRSPRR